MSYKLLSFTQRASAGAQAVTGAGFQPKAVILWTTWDVGTGLFNDAEICEGASDGVTQFARSSICLDGFAGASNGFTYGAILRRLNTAGSPAATCAATLASLDADGFTLTWSASDAAGATIHALVIGGSSIQATLIPGTLPSGVTTPLTGAGFVPTAAMVWAAKTGSPTTTGSFAARHSWGFSAGANQCSCATLESGAFGRKNRTTCSLVDNIVATVFQENGILSGGAASHHRVSSFDADGLTFADGAGSYGGTADVAVLCLRGVTIVAGEVLAPLAPGLIVETCDVQPELLLFHTADGAFTGSPILGGARYGFGAWTEAGQVTIGAGSDDTGQFSAVHTDVPLRLYAPGATPGASTLRVKASVDSIQDDGFTLDFTTVAGGGEFTRVQYMAFGPTIPGGCDGGEVTETPTPAAGDDFSALRTSVDAWIELYLDDGTEAHGPIEGPLNDPPTYHAGKKTARITDFGEVTQKLCDPVSGYQSSGCSVSAAEQDRHFRAKDPTETYFTQEARIMAALRSTRQSGGEATVVMRGAITGYNPQSGLSRGFEFLDVLA
jgi:hypothetical protein